MKGLARFTAFAALCTYLSLCLSACAMQRSILYHPDRDVSPPAAFGLKGFDEATLTDADGTRIAAWVKPAKAGYPTLVFFHGNGGNITGLSPYLEVLGAAGFGVLAIDYRGYGASEGSPTEAGIYEDARAAMQYAAKVMHVPPQQTLLYGESLGTGVAVEMATEFTVAGVVLQSPYTSIEDLGYARMPYLPVHLLLIDRFDSASKINRVHVPLLVMHGRLDGIVPLQYGERLYAKANEPKEFVYFDAYGHNDLPTEGRAAALLAFGRKYDLIPQ